MEQKKNIKFQKELKTGSKFVFKGKRIQKHKWKLEGDFVFTVNVQIPKN